MWDAFIVDPKAQSLTPSGCLPSGCLTNPSYPAFRAAVAKNNRTQPDFYCPQGPSGIMDTTGSASGR